MFSDATTRYPDGMKLRRILRQIQSKHLLPQPRTQLPGFDATYYLYWYRDVARYGAGPLEHYLTIGWKEGRDPSAGFSTDGYLTANPDVKASDVNPLIHFLEYGLAEGREGFGKDPGLAPPKPRMLPPDGSQKLLAPPKDETASV